jgi:hypothetical protein
VWLRCVCLETVRTNRHRTRTTVPCLSNPPRGRELNPPLPTFFRDLLIGIPRTPPRDSRIEWCGCGNRTHRRSTICLRSRLPEPHIVCATLDLSDYLHQSGLSLRAARRIGEGASRHLKTAFSELSAHSPGRHPKRFGDLFPRAYLAFSLFRKAHPISCLNINWRFGLLSACVWAHFLLLVSLFQ